MHVAAKTVECEGRNVFDTCMDYVLTHLVCRRTLNVQIYVISLSCVFSAPSTSFMSFFNHKTAENTDKLPETTDKGMD